VKSEITIRGKDPEDRHRTDIVAGQEELIYRRSILGVLTSTLVAGYYKISVGFDDRPTWESAKWITDPVTLGERSEDMEEYVKQVNQ